MMTIDYSKLKARRFESLEQNYSRHTGRLRQDPSHLRQLCFVYEPQLLALPTTAVVLACPGFWHAPLPVAGTVIGISRVAEIVVKAPDKSAVIYTAQDVFDCSTGHLLATLSQSVVCRGDGGFGGLRHWPEARRPQPIPESPPHDGVTLTSRPEAAIIYRLAGGYNPPNGHAEVAP